MDNKNNSINFSDLLSKLDNNVVDKPLSNNLKTEEVVSDNLNSQYNNTFDNTALNYVENNNQVVSSMSSEVFSNKINLDTHSSFLNKNNNRIDLSRSKHFIVRIKRKKEPFIKFAIGVLSYALFIWLLLVGITLIVYVSDIKIKEMKGDYSNPKFNAYVVLSGSMIPNIDINDVVVTKMVDPTKLKKDDIITFSSNDSRFLGTIITHRIIKADCKKYRDEFDTCYFETKGDNNNVVDTAKVVPSNIYGKVIFKIPKLGYVQRLLASRGGFIFVILIPCLLVVSYDVVKLIKNISMRKKIKVS